MVTLPASAATEVKAAGPGVWRLGESTPPVCALDAPRCAAITGDMLRPILMLAAMVSTLSAEPLNLTVRSQVKRTDGSFALAENVILCGVHLNMCVLGRPFAIRQQAYLGENVVLMRDMTDTRYNPERPPGVDHFTGTDLMVTHVEKYWCPSFTSADITGEGTQSPIKARFAGDFSGTIDLAGTPYYDPGTRALSFPDLDYTLDSDQSC